MRYNHNGFQIQARRSAKLKGEQDVSEAAAARARAVRAENIRRTAVAAQLRAAR